MYTVSLWVRYRQEPLVLRFKSSTRAREIAALACGDTSRGHIPGPPPVLTLADDYGATHRLMITDIWGVTDQDVAQALHGDMQFALIHQHAQQELQHKIQGNTILRAMPAMGTMSRA